MKIFYSLILLLVITSAKAQQLDTVFLKNMLQSHPELFSGILKHPTQNEIQILYTQIDRDAKNVPHFRSFSYRLNPRRYFYPASTVKLPTAIFALEKLNELKTKGLNKHNNMLTDSGFIGQTKVLRDSSSANGFPSIENYIKKILLVSDNDAYNRLYEFVGREELNIKLKKYELSNTRIIGRLAIGDGGEGARHTNPIDFYNNDKLVYHKPALYDAGNYPMQLDNMIQGKGYLDKDDKLVMQPFDLVRKTFTQLPTNKWF